MGSVWPSWCIFLVECFRKSSHIDPLFTALQLPLPLMVNLEIALPAECIAWAVEVARFLATPVGLDAFVTDIAILQLVAIFGTPKGLVSGDNRSGLGAC